MDARWGVWLALGMAFFPEWVIAQPPPPKITSLFPAGGKSGSTVEVQLTAGEHLDSVTALWASAPGVVAERVPVAESENSDSSSPRFRLHLPADLPCGVIDLVAYGAQGASAPRRFAVGGSEETVSPANCDRPERAAPIRLNQIINGVFRTPRDIHWFRCSGRAGQRLQVVCWAEDIDSPLRPVVSIHDSAGRRLATAPRSRINDVQLSFTLPADAEYFIQLHDLLYRGGAEFVYRLGVSDDRVENATPAPAVKAEVSGDALEVKLENESAARWDLTMPIGTKSLEEGFLAPEALARWLPFARQASNFCERPHARERAITLTGTSAKSATVTGTAEVLNWPCTVPLQLEPGQRVTYQLQLAKDDAIHCEVFAERLGQTMDAALLLEEVTPGKGAAPATFKKMTEADDQKVVWLAGKFESVTDDPELSFTAPADGTYRLTVFDRYTGPRTLHENGSVLRIERQAPRVTLRAVPGDPLTTTPTSFCIPAGGTTAIEILAQRQFGATQKLFIRPRALPWGVSTPGAVLPADATHARLVLFATSDAVPGPFRCELEAVVVSDDIEQQETLPVAFALASRAASDVQLAEFRVRPVAPLIVLTDAAPCVVELNCLEGAASPGRQLELSAKVHWKAGYEGQIELAPYPAGGPSGLEFTPSTIARGERQQRIRCWIPPKAPLGEQVISLQATAEYQPTATPGGAPPAEPAAETPPVKKWTAATSAVRLKLVAPQLTLQTAPTEIKDAKPGSAAPLHATIVRQADYAEPVVLSLHLPDGRSDLRLNDIELTGDVLQAALAIKIAESAKPGAVWMPTLRAKTLAGEVLADAPLTLSIAAPDPPRE